MTLGEAIEHELKMSDAYFEQADKLNDMRATTTDHTFREQYKEMAVDFIEEGANHRMIAVWLEQYKKLKDAYQGALELLEQEQKTGHWKTLGIQGEVDGQIVQVFTCSECGAISIFRMTSGNIVNGDICPNCGAKMVEPQESEEI